MAKTKAKPLTRFRVYAADSSLYFLVAVWRTKKEMLDNRVTLGLPRSTCDAHTFSYDQFTDKTRTRKLPIVGEIHFHKRKLLADAGVEAVSHEALHAIASLLRRLRFDFAAVNQEGMSRAMRGKMDAEERVADLHGKMSRAIMMRLHDVGLFPWQDEQQKLK